MTSSKELRTQQGIGDPDVVSTAESHERLGDASRALAQLYLRDAIIDEAPHFPVSNNWQDQYALLADVYPEYGDILFDVPETLRIVGWMDHELTGGKIGMSARRQSLVETYGMFFDGVNSPLARRLLAQILIAQSTTSCEIEEQVIVGAEVKDKRLIEGETYLDTDFEKTLDRANDIRQVLAQRAPNGDVREATLDSIFASVLSRQISIAVVYPPIQTRRSKTGDI